MVASRTNGESWAPRCVIVLYGFEQRAGELLQASDEPEVSCTVVVEVEPLCRGINAAEESVRSVDNDDRKCMIRDVCS